MVRPVRPIREIRNTNTAERRAIQLWQVYNVAESTLAPVYLAFFLNYLAGWAPFGACRGCLPLCRWKMLPRPEPPIAATGIYNLGVLAVIMRLSMWPNNSSAWKPPPRYMFLVFKFVASLFLFEFANSCIWMAIERILYQGIPSLCDEITDGVFGGIPGLSQTSTAICPIVVDTPWVLVSVSYFISVSFFLCALSAARFLDFAELFLIYPIVVSSVGAVLLKIYLGENCNPFVTYK